MNDPPISAFRNPGGVAIVEGGNEGKTVTKKKYRLDTSR